MVSKYLKENCTQVLRRIIHDRIVKKLRCFRDQVIVDVTKLVVQIALDGEKVDDSRLSLLI